MRAADCTVDGSWRAIAAESVVRKHSVLPQHANRERDAPQQRRGWPWTRATPLCARTCTVRSYVVTKSPALLLAASITVAPVRADTQEQGSNF